MGLVEFALLDFFVFPWFSGFFGLILLSVIMGLYRLFKLPKGPSPKEWMGRAVGHRGLREKRAPENSLRSLDLALTESVDTVEIDIHLSKDNEIVVFHDYTLTRMMGVNKTINQCTAAELWSYRYKGFEDSYNNEGIPSLEQVLDLVFKKHKGRILIELKGITIGPKYIKDITDKLIEFYKRYGCYDTACVISFNPIALYALRKKEPRIPTCILYYPNLWDHYIRSPAEAADIPAHLKRFAPYADKILTWCCRTWLPEFLGATFVGPNFEEVSKSYIRKWEQKDIGVYTWTVNDRNLSRYLRDQGVVAASDSFDADQRKKA
jgi:glycerophosphoryl diester phosphodiesterase